MTAPDAGLNRSPRAFRDRREAGRQLAAKLAGYASRSDVVVLALPRGGVPVAYEVAQALHAPLDVFVVRKLGIPGHEEFAMGAVASGGVRVLNERLIEQLRIPKYIVDMVTAEETEELKRHDLLYRGGRPPPEVRGKTVILVDDGLATGATMLAAVQALRQLHPARIVVAVPTASSETCEALRREVDEVICAVTPEPFHAVGFWYEDFSQTTDDEVRELLAQSRQPRPVSPPDPIESPVAVVRAAARPLTGAEQDYDPLLERIGDARLVLLGEATHGTHEFYEQRAEITRRLIVEKGFTAVAAEADWPDAYRVNRYVRGLGSDVDAAEALADFRRFPTWMWRNTEVVAFIEWLRGHNLARPPGAAKSGFYGLDLYSLHASMKAVLQYLERVDPAAARRARERYACFDQFVEPQTYGFMSGLNLTKSCQDDAIAQLVELQTRATENLGAGADEDAFAAEQNARVVQNAESYYRTMFLAEESSWNLRDRHMVETLENLMTHLDREVGRSKMVVWAHNSHLGDARATEMSRRGELNVGQLVREKYGSDAVLVGFTTYHGTVTAASRWDAAAERKTVLPALDSSYEALFHAARPGRFLLERRNEVIERLHEPRLERAIGVVYRPDTERASHYFQARLPDQFDVVLHFDRTRALEPLEVSAEWRAGEVPETFPFGV
jgi:erythromycin esterase-like protein/adenine/guanine phosphoribosyltransferase-like PRPP-binding protein